MNINFGLQGKYRCEVHRGDEIIAETDWFSNLILDQGKDYIGTHALSTQNDLLGFAQVGTGTSAAASTQTQLDSFLAGQARFATPPWTNSGSPNYTRTIVCEYRFAQGAVIGNISEVGIGRIGTNGELFSRARIVDGGSNPTTLALTSLDRLYVFYTLTLIPVLTNSTGSVLLDGISYSYTAYSNNAGAAAGHNYNQPRPGYPAFSVALSGSESVNQGYLYQAGTVVSPTILTDVIQSGTSTSVSTPNSSSYSYSLGSFTGITYWNIAPTVGNPAGGIQGILAFLYAFGTIFNVYYSFATPIPKTSSKRLILAMSVSWN